MAKKGGLGWRRSPPDYRDHRFSVKLEVLQNLPPAVDLRPQCPPIVDQEQIGSCTANALAYAVRFDRRKEGLAPDFEPSRLFIYYNERELEGDVPIDGGAYLRDGIKSLTTIGVCPEDEWPYVPTPPPSDGGLFPAGSPPVTKPPQQCYDDAGTFKIVSYETVSQTIGQLRGTLAQGFPFVFGFSVYLSLWDAAGKPKTVIPLPSGDDKLVGGHAVMIVGYDDATSLFTIQNSWGTDTGDNGYFYMPYSYVTDPKLSDDFWVIRTTAG